MDKDNKTSHTRKATEILTQLAENVSVDDKKAAAIELDLCKVTINDYLRGKVRELGTAEKLIVFFRQRVNRREKLFNDQEVVVA